MATDLLEPVATQPPIQDDDPLYEVIDGVRVELPPMSTLSSLVATEINGSLVVYSRSTRKGRSAMETLIRLPLPRARNRRPDVFWVSGERWPLDRPIPATGNAWEVVPELAVEVVSPGDLADEIMDKILEDFEAGVRLVWLVYSRQRLIHVYSAPSEIEVLDDKATLQGGDVLPGFQQKIADLFPPIAEEPMNGKPAEK